MRICALTPGAVRVKVPTMSNILHEISSGANPATCVQILESRASGENAACSCEEAETESRAAAIREGSCS